MDPIAMITAIAEATKAGFVFGATEQGQEIIKDWRANTATFNAALARAGAWLEGRIETLKQEKPPK